MPCPNCGSDAISALGRCSRCGSAAVDTVRSDAQVNPGDVPTSISGADARTGFAATPADAATSLATGPLAPGQPFGPRYHIIRVLGSGGMGVVYQAWDGELGVAVALKVIRPEVLADSGSSAEVERRFKRELVLARQVTHKNVVRIHDLGELDGIKYLTMPFVEGENLAAVLRRRGKLPLPEALAIARQVASGLAAAHDVGVVHRDLKPENIMLEADGDALIMDFGISRSVSGTGTATQLGAVLGTLEYMAPEQAQGRQVDQRADIYSFGLMIYDMIAGRQRLAGRDNPMSEMLSRMAAGPLSVRAVDPAVPEPVDRILSRCLAISPDARYATATALLRDLEELTPDGHIIQTSVPGAAPAGVPRKTVALGGGAAVLLVLGAVALWMVLKGAPSQPAGPREPVSVLVANFENRANDEQFDGLLEQALAVGIEGTSFVTAFPRRDALRVARQIAPDKPLNEEVARLVSTREGIDVIVTGAISLEGGEYKLQLKVVNLSGAKPLLEWDTEVASKDKVLEAVGEGAARVRGALGDTKAGAGAAETFTAGSLEAAHAYAKAQELTWTGAKDAAIAEYEKAVRLDPRLGRAYSGLAALHFNAGRRDKALEYYQLAMSHTDRMTERERLRTRGGYYLMIRNSAKANEEFQALIDKYPADNVAIANLAVNRVYERKMTEAVELGKRASAIYPKNLLQRNNVALFAMYAGDFESAEREALGVLALNAEYTKAFVALAMSYLGRGQIAEAEATWRKLEAIPAGRPFAVAGLADLALFRGRIADAARILQPASGSTAEVDPRHLVTLAETHLARGNDSAAAATAIAAAASKGKEDVLFLAGRVLTDLRRPQAGELAARLRKEIDQEPQIYGALLAGEIALKQGDVRSALDRFNEAQKLTDTWLGRYGLGRAQLAAGRYPEAESELDKCLARRGEATAAFLDEIPTYRMLPPVHYYMGLVRAGLKNDRGAAESFQTFLDLKKDGDEQGLVADARRRLQNR